MKKIFLSLVVISTFIMLIDGQVKLTSKTHGFRAGDSHDFIITKNADEGLAGENVIWDFSGLEKTEKTLTSHMLSPEGLTNSDSISNSNLVLEEYGTHFYFNTSNDIMEQYGTVCCNTITRYDKPFVKLKFPFSYGNKVAGFYSGVQESNNSSSPVSGSYEIFGDATGTLLLPNDITIDNVLRVKQTRTIENNNGSKINEITYRWYASDVRYPVLVIIKYVTPTSSSVAQTALYAHSVNYKKSATSIASAGFISSFEVYPNPCDEQLTINYSMVKSGKITIELYDATGKYSKTIVSNIKSAIGQQNLVINASENGIQRGIYYLRLTAGDDSFTQKIIKL
jgi:hypothetical protein